MSWLSWGGHANAGKDTCARDFTIHLSGPSWGDRESKACKFFSLIGSSSLFPHEDKSRPQQHCWSFLSSLMVFSNWGWLSWVCPCPVHRQRPRPSPTYSLAKPTNTFFKTLVNSSPFLLLSIKSVTFSCQEQMHLSPIYETQKGPYPYPWFLSTRNTPPHRWFKTYRGFQYMFQATKLPCNPPHFQHAKWSSMNWRALLSCTHRPNYSVWAAQLSMFWPDPPEVILHDALLPSIAPFHSWQ